MIKKLQNFGDAYRGCGEGLDKSWPLKSKHDYDMLHDFLQKINFCIQDLNGETDRLNNLCPKDIVYIIVLTTWVQEAVNKILDLYRPEILSGFSFDKENELEEANRYIKAIRSFVVAHPLSTDRHSKYGLDGNFICVDIYSTSSVNHSPLMRFSQHYHLDFDGIHDYVDSSDDFYLHCYSKKDDNMQFFRDIGCSISDIYQVAELYLSKLYALDRYLKRQKMLDYKGK